MPQARPAPARSLRLPDKLPPPPPQKPWLRATPTRPRSPDADGILRTPPPLPPGERPKAPATPATPAKAAARAPPDPLRHPRPTASPSLHHHGHYHYHRSSSADFPFFAWPAHLSHPGGAFRCDPRGGACTIKYQMGAHSSGAHYKP